MARDTSSPPSLATLLRWIEFGGTWTLLHCTETSATVSLRRCDGGEEVERLTSGDPALLAFVATPPTVEV